MRVLAIGDIHGCIFSLTTLERFVPIETSDLLVTLGDYVDRGPESSAVLDWLIARKTKDRLIPLRGNHELMMCAARVSERHYDEWIACGGDAALRSYGGSLHNVPESHWEFMRRDCRPFYETSRHFFVHANAYPDLPLDEQPDYMLYWESFNDPPMHESGKIMVCGHTPQKSGRPKDTANAICIDTRVHAGGWLTCLDVASGKYWQANEQSDTRTGFLEVPV